MGTVIWPVAKFGCEQLGEPDELCWSLKLLPILLVLITDEVDWWRAALMAAPEGRVSVDGVTLLLGDMLAEVGRIGSMGNLAGVGSG